ncbi:MAG TPA: hypothetical protein VNB64_07180 [Solirubrobacteraceae bacterium]|nr:hypothetical protein [Solirubrobacteraceae bacterium]
MPSVVRHARCFAFLAVTASSLSLAPAASGAIHPQTAGELSAITEFAYENSPVATKPACGDLCQEMAYRERVGLPAEIDEQQFRRQMRRLRSRAKLTYGIRFLARSVPIAWQGYEVFQIGWKIGSMFERVTIHQPAANHVRWVETRVGWSLSNEGAYSPSPADGLKMEWSETGSNWLTSTVPDTTQERDNVYKQWYTCPPIGPGGRGLPGTIAIDYSLSLGCHGSDPAYALLVTDDSMIAGIPEVYSTQPYDREDPPVADPGILGTRQSLQDDLSGDPGAEAERFLDDAADPANRPGDEHDPRCERSSPVPQSDTPPSESLDARWEIVDPKPYVDSQVRSSRLRRGWHSLAGGRKRGFGYRHILHRHGWSAADEADTRTAMLFDTEPTIDSNGFDLYEGPEYQQGNSICRRDVVVSYDRAGIDAKWGKPPKGIITSYGKFLRYV